MSEITPKVALYSCGSWHLPNTAKAFEHRKALSGIYVSDPNRWEISPYLYHQCRIFDLFMRSVRYPFKRHPYWNNRIFWLSVPLWQVWLRTQRFPDDAHVVQALGIFSKEPFDLAEKHGCLKVFDAPNGHPCHQEAVLQAEYNRWGAGSLVKEFYWYKPRALRDLERADLVLCPSTFVKGTMVENGVDPDRCRVVPFGVDTDRFPPRERVPEKPVFLSVGFLSMRKGQIYLLQAFERLKCELPEAELIIVGGIHHDFHHLYPKWKGTFTHIPYVNHEELSRLYRSASAFVMPSLEEGYARVIPEAMASGLPQILTRETGAGEQLLDGVNGFWVEPRNVDQLVERMLLLGRDRELNTAMGLAAAQLQQSHYNWSDYGDALHGIYRAALNGD